MLDSLNLLIVEPLDLIVKKRDIFMTNIKAINGMLSEYLTQLFHTCEPVLRTQWLRIVQ